MKKHLLKHIEILKTIPEIKESIEELKFWQLFIWEIWDVGYDDNWWNGWWYWWDSVFALCKHVDEDVVFIYEAIWISHLNEDEYEIIYLDDEKITESYKNDYDDDSWEQFKIIWQAEVKDLMAFDWKLIFRWNQVFMPVLWEKEWHLICEINPKKSYMEQDEEDFFIPLNEYLNKWI
jgi:hypothetical protein